MSLSITHNEPTILITNFNHSQINTKLTQMSLQYKNFPGYL